MGNQGTLESITELRTFCAIVEEESLVAAARILDVTANAVSRRLAVLEDRLERRLIHRTTRKLSVTDEGMLFYGRCRRILDELEEAERELAGGDMLSGTLRLGLHTDMVSGALMRALGTLLKSAPALKIQLRSASRFVEPIAAGLDLSIFVGKPPASSLIAVRLGTLVWSLFATPAYIAARGTPDSPEELCNHECLRILRDGQERNWSLKRASGRSKLYPIAGRFETSDARALEQALGAGLGIGVQLRSKAADDVAKGILVSVLPDWQWSSTPVYALLPKGRTKLPAVRMLLEALKTATTELY